MALPQEAPTSVMASAPSGPPRPRHGQGRKVLILTPQDWFVEECCVQPNSGTTPSAPLMLAALLRQHGHYPQVLTHLNGNDIRFNIRPDVIVIYSPYHHFVFVAAKLAGLLRQIIPESVLTLVMYDSHADCEIQAMLACPDIDYAVVPHEKELSVLGIVEHGQRRCPGGFDNGMGIVYRDDNDQPIDTGRKKALADLDHLPYIGRELSIFLGENKKQAYDTAAITFQRGCPNPCTFCPMRGTRPRYRDPELVAREMAIATSLTGASYLLTLEVMQDQEPLDKLCDLAIARNIPMANGLGARCEQVRDQALIDKLARAGLRSLYFGIEAADEHSRGLLRKPISDASMRQAIEITSRAGLQFTCSFITGFPWENERYYQQLAVLLLELARHQQCRRINLARLMPWPGLPITQELIASGIMEQELTFTDWNTRFENIFSFFRRTLHLSHRELEDALRILTSATSQIIDMRNKRAQPAGQGCVASPA